MTTFVLVHGAFHGAWCWQPLIEHLTASGHGAVAVDLPIDDASAGWHDHVEAVLDGVPESPRSILVGHSRAGRLLPLVLERRHFDAVVYIASSLPDPLGAPTRRCDSIPMLLPAHVGLVRDEFGRVVCPTERAVAMYYHDCSPELRDWAVARLRPQFDIEYPRPETQPDTPQPVRRRRRRSRRQHRVDASRGNRDPRTTGRRTPQRPLPVPLRHTATG